MAAVYTKLYITRNFLTYNICKLSANVFSIMGGHRHHVTGYENFIEFMKRFNNETKTSEEEVFVYFSGSKASDGNSWCDDCVRAWPTIDQCLKKYLRNENMHFVYVEVGDRTFWKDQKCPFRQDRSTKLMVLPTIMRWKGIQRLEGDQCEKAELLELIFTED